MEHISSLPNETVLHRFTTSSYVNGEEVSVYFCFLSFLWTLHLTDRRIAIRVVKKLFGFSFHEREESFRYKDLKHVSISTNIAYWKFFFSLFSLTTVLCIVDVIRYLSGDTENGSDISFFSTAVFEMFAIVEMILVLVGVVLSYVLFVMALVESFYFKSVSLDFYKKERVESWHFFAAYTGRFGSPTTRTLRFSTEQCHAIAKALHEHGKTQLLDDSVSSNPSRTIE